MKPFKLFLRECSVQELQDRFSAIGYDLEVAEIPDSAYGNSLLRFQSKEHLVRPIKIVVEKWWWPDGMNWEDKTVRLIIDEGEVLATIDLWGLLREELDKPLRQFVADSLIESVSKARSLHG